MKGFLLIKKPNINKDTIGTGEKSSKRKTQLLYPGEEYFQLKTETVLISDLHHKHFFSTVEKI